MPLTWTGVVDELRRADLLVDAPARAADPTGIGVDSRAIQQGMLYLALRGSQADGHHFVGDAVRRGATAVMVEAPQQPGVPEIVVRDSHRAALILGSAWYAHPARNLTLIGVTGTNGKTTTTGLIRHLFNEDETAGSIGTLGAFDGRGHAVSSRASREGIKGMGLKLFGPDEDLNSAVTAAWVPDGIDGKALVRLMFREHGIQVAGGQGPMEGRIFRIGHCGYFDSYDIIATIAAAELALESLDHPVELGRGVGAAQRVFSRSGVVA